jgi:DNA-binding response OmpR family regulator
MARKTQNSTDRLIKIFISDERNKREKKCRVLDSGASEFVVKPPTVEAIVQKTYTILAEQVLNQGAPEPLRHTAT